MNTPTTLTERYELTAHLARGGMADVYQGQDSLLGRKVAIKVLHSQLSSDEAFVKRFRKEAQAAANLTHPNIVGIYDWGQFDHTYFIVMELVNGRSVRDVLRSEGALLPRRAVEIAAEVAAALAVAHRAGLVHRDVKPGNILLAPDGTVKVTDFGIARAWDDSQELTRTGAVMGTATYFSPEQAQGTKVDERSDIYSLGVVLYEMLTGTPPFRGDSPVSVAYQHVSQEALAPSVVNPDVPLELDTIVLKAMHKDPARRYQSAEELRADLWRALQGERPLAAAPVPAGQEDATATRMMPTTTAPPATVPPDEGYRQLEEPPSSNLAFVLGTFALLATLGVLVFLVFRLLGGPGETVSETVSVPNVVGSSRNEALRTLQNEGLIALPADEVNADVTAGVVIRTEPGAGIEVDRGTTVTVYVSSGPEEFAVPPLLDLPQAEAENLIRANGFQVGTITPQADPDREPGIVIGQDPSSGVTVPANTPINLTVSSGPETITLPPLDGEPEGEATSQLDALGLEWSVTPEFSDEVERGLVIRTTPAGGSPVTQDTAIEVVVSDGPEPVELPDLTGAGVNEAQSIIESLGLAFRVANSRIEVQDPNLWDKVVDQNPDPGTMLRAGDTVTVTLGVQPTTTTTTAPPETTTTAGGDGGGPPGPP